LSLRLPYEEATHQAAQVGRTFGIAGAGIGLLFALFGSMPFGSVLVLCAAGLFLAATYEDRLVRHNARLNAWQVQQVTQPIIHSVSPHQPVGAAMLGLAVTQLVPVVMDDSTRLIGVVVAGDLARLTGRNLSIAHVMRTRFPSVSSGDPLWIAYEKLRRSRLKAIPVIDHGRLRGLVTLTDIQRTLRDFQKPYGTRK
jgi:signal-transduction protein with cAMP-binding, CBS, and nucleotidyltransferase domain